MNELQLSSGGTVHVAEGYRVCTRCVMDTSDPDTVFDENGICNHCRAYERLVQTHLLPEPERQAFLDRLVNKIKTDGKDKPYDCLIGVSGGVDSTYLAYITKQLGLRPLAVHMDNGWNSELAVNNIEQILRNLGIDLHTVVLDWEEFKDLQLSFLEASVTDAEVPTDHAIVAVLFQTAAKQSVRYILLGSNIVTEGLYSSRWTYGYYDWRYIRSIHRMFGKRPLRSFPHLSYFDGSYFRYRAVKRIKRINLLNYVPYSKPEAMRVLRDELGWRPYGGKHYESIYTRFFQAYILPKKFNLDKRKGHLSTLIMSGQMTREEALEELSKPPYDGYMLEEDIEYVLKKFGLSEQEFECIMALPPKTYRDYPNSSRLETLIKGSWIIRGAQRFGLLPVEK